MKAHRQMHRSHDDEVSKHFFRDIPVSAYLIIIWIEDAVSSVNSGCCENIIVLEKIFPN